MAFYNQHVRQQSWDPSQIPGPPTQVGLGDDRWSGRNSAASSHEPNTPTAAPGATLQRDESVAFVSQFEEVARAHENLAKSGRAFGMHAGRDSFQGTSLFARQYPEFDRGMAPSRHQPIGDYEGTRSHSSHSSSSYQGYLANQRFGPRTNEAEHMLQYKRRAAAQRERELRNYHQEQQYNRNSSQSGPKSDRSLSPNAMNEDDRRDLIARQHRALYGDGSSLYGSENNSSRPLSQDARVLATGEAPSSGYESYASPPGGGSAVEAPASSLSATSGHGSRSRENSVSSKSPGPNAFGMFDGAQQTNRTSSSSPGTSPTRQGSGVSGSGNVAPIGTRPNQSASKRNTPPMPSPLAANSSSPANPTSSGPEKPSPVTWNNNSGPWGPNNKTQTSVWG